MAVRARFIRLVPESGELLHLDALRLLAALAIVVVHFRTNLLAAWPGSGELHRRLDGLSTGVDLFFVISGFVICWVYAGRMASPADFALFLRKRIARLVPLHWLTLAFFAFVGVAATLSDTVLSRAGKYEFSCFVPNALLVHAWGLCDAPSFNTVSWSISAEMAMYLAFPVLLAALKRAPVAFLAALTVLIVWLETRGGNPSWADRTYAGGVIRAVPGFCLGMVLYHFRTPLARLPFSRTLLALALTGFAAAVAGGAPRSALVLVAYLVAILGIAADLRGCAGPVVRRLAPGGRLTYSIYMLHPIVQSLFIVLLGRRALGLSGWPLTAWSALAVFFAMAMGYVSLCMFEEPARRMLSRNRRPTWVDKTR